MSEISQELQEHTGTDGENSDTQMAYICGRLDRTMQEADKQDKGNWFEICRFLLGCSDEERSRVLAGFREMIDSRR